jgi:hypothetical protein
LRKKEEPIQREKEIFPFINYNLERIKEDNNEENEQTPEEKKLPDVKDK